MVLIAQIGNGWHGMAWLHSLLAVGSEFNGSGGWTLSFLRLIALVVGFGTDDNLTTRHSLMEWALSEILCRY